MSLFGLRHPVYTNFYDDWCKYRLCYYGGECFLDHYLQKFSKREDEQDFRRRKCTTPIPSFAKTAVNEVRNSIFQRLADVSRKDGSAKYQRAMKGEDGGVDNRGRSMMSYIGQEILTEMLVIGRCGIYVDAPNVVDGTLLGESSHKPYLYKYTAEDIINWERSCPENPSEFQSIVLREEHTLFNASHGLPEGTCNRFRRVWIDKDDGFVRVQFETENEKIRNSGRFEDEGQTRKLALTKIPFTLFDLGDSLMKDVCNHQIALLNLWSSNVAYGLTSNFPFLVIQEDKRDVGQHLKTTGNGGTPGTGTDKNRIEVGNVKGRTYDMGANSPDFIHPSSEPLTASLEMCQQLKEDIRQLISLAVADLGSRQSGLSKEMDSQGLEAGLSFIGLVLESGEREIANHWAAYENSVEAKREIPTITYPRRWNLKTDEQRVKEATGIYDACNKLPGNSVKKEASKILVTALIGHQVSAATLDTIKQEIDAANYTTSDPAIIQMARENGLVGDETGSKSLGYDTAEAERAKEDHVDRLSRIQIAQTSQTDGNNEGPVQGVTQEGQEAKEQKRMEKENANGLAENRSRRGNQKRV